MGQPWTPASAKSKWFPHSRKYNKTVWLDKLTLPTSETTLSQYNTSHDMIFPHKTDVSIFVCLRHILSLRLCDFQPNNKHIHGGRKQIRKSYSLINMEGLVAHQLFPSLLWLSLCQFFQQEVNDPGNKMNHSRHGAEQLWQASETTPDTCSCRAGERERGGKTEME